MMESQNAGRWSDGRRVSPAPPSSWFENAGAREALPLWTDGGAVLEAARAAASREDSAEALASEGASSVGLCRAALGWGCVSGVLLLVAASCVALDAAVSALGGESALRNF